jgi:hypothetical protein
MAGPSDSHRAPLGLWPGLFVAGFNGSARFLAFLLKLGRPMDVLALDADQDRETIAIRRRFEKA